MSATDALLLALAIAVFFYIGYALVAAERF